MTEPTSMPPPAQASVEAKKTKSKGEKFFDRFVYGGLAGIGTFVLTLYMANKFKNGEWAGPLYSRTVDRLHEFLKRVLPNKASREVAEETIQTTSLMMGGNAMLLPIGLAEHFKTNIVEGLNVAMGDPTPPAKIEQAPKQTWLSLIEGRGLAWLAVFGALITARFALPKSFETYCHEFGERTHQLVQWIKRKPVAADVKNTTSYRVGNLAALDIFATAAAATLLYVGGHFFARKQEERKERRASGHLPLRAEGEDAVALDGGEFMPAPTSQVHGQKHVAGTVQAAPELQSAIQA